MCSHSIRRGSRYAVKELVLVKIKILILLEMVYGALLMTNYTAFLTSTLAAIITRYTQGIALQIMLDAGLARGPEALDPEKLGAFVDGAMDGYNGVAFHNMYHGFSVMHVTACIIIEAKAVEILSWHDVAVALLAAIGHDLDHPGTNNGFEVSTVSERACRHGFDSVCCCRYWNVERRLP